MGLPRQKGAEVPWGRGGGSSGGPSSSLEAAASSPVGARHLRLWAAQGKKHGPYPYAKMLNWIRKAAFGGDGAKMRVQHAELRCWVPLWFLENAEGLSDVPGERGAGGRTSQRRGQRHGRSGWGVEVISTLGWAYSLRCLPAVLSRRGRAAPRGGDGRLGGAGCGAEPAARRGRGDWVAALPAAPSCPLLRGPPPATLTAAISMPALQLSGGGSSGGAAAGGGEQAAAAAQAVPRQPPLAQGLRVVEDFPYLSQQDGTAGKAGGTATPQPMDYQASAPSAADASPGAPCPCAPAGQRWAEPALPLPPPPPPSHASLPCCRPPSPSARPQRTLAWW